MHEVELSGQPNPALTLRLLARASPTRARETFIQWSASRSPSRPVPSPCQPSPSPSPSPCQPSPSRSPSHPLPRSRPLTLAQVKSIEEVRSVVHEAFRVASTGKRGPVHLDLPKDVMTAVLRGSSLPLPMQPPPIPVDPRTLERCAELLAIAKKPIFYVGQGANDAPDELLALAEACQVTCTRTRTYHAQAHAHPHPHPHPHPSALTSNRPVPA